MHVARSLACSLLLVLAPTGWTRQGEAPELVLVNGKILTLEEDQPEVSALAARGGRILALGTDEEVRRLAGPGTRVIDLAGQLAVPGFIEGHAHFLGIGDGALQLQLTGARSFEEIVQAVAAAVARARPGELVRGRGWHQEKWGTRPERTVEGMPLHHALSAVSPENPVILVHASGHASFANARALELAGITRETPDPPGGTIVRDERGEPTGALRETAAALLAPVRAAATPPSKRRMAELAVSELLSKGITSVQDAGSSFEEVELYRRMADEGALRCRLWVMLREPNEALATRLAAARTIGYADERLTVRAIKRAIDGALGSHGAWLLEPYADLPGNTGLNTTPVPELAETARLALEHGFQLCVHAIGDRANRETLDLFERALDSREDGRGLRWRVEHAQHLHPDDVPRFAALGVIASMQAVHCTSDAPWVVPRLGEERARSGAYLWRSLIDSGAVVSNGSDAPVEDCDPIAGLYASITRRLADGSSFFPAQRMSRMEALLSFTKHAAYAAFEEDRKGTLAVGKLADVTVLSKDISSVPEEELLGARVVYTIVGGRVEHAAPPAPDPR